MLEDGLACVEGLRASGLLSEAVEAFLDIGLESDYQHAFENETLYAYCKPMDRLGFDDLEAVQLITNQQSGFH